LESYSHFLTIDRRANDLCRASLFQVSIPTCLNWDYFQPRSGQRALDKQTFRHTGVAIIG
jgi:hypothetical protein